METTDQPIVIIGGFMAGAPIYDGLRSALASVSGQSVDVVPTLGPEWAMAVSRLGWLPLLMQVERTVRHACAASATGKITLVGHSAGGVLGRLYLGDLPFFGHKYSGYQYVNTLVTLGSPHHNAGGLARGGLMANYVQSRYPGAYYAQVRYVTVAGRAIAGDPAGSARERRIARAYRRICGHECIWGDGVVPVQSALLQGTEQISLDGVWHFGLGGRWYGSTEVVPRWWHQVAANPVPCEGLAPAAQGRAQNP